MATCDVCDKSVKRGDLERRLAIPEYRAMIGIWPWHEKRVCAECRDDYDADFMERLRLLAPDVLANDEPITAKVCLACGTVEADTWHQVGKWIDADGNPTRRATFYLCDEHAYAVYVDGIVVTPNVGERFSKVLEELPVAGYEMLARVEGWEPGAGSGPPEADHFIGDRDEEETAGALEDFWHERPEGLEARAAVMGPIRKDYRMRYRLDLIRDLAGGLRETLVAIRTSPTRFATYRLTAHLEEASG